MDTDDNTRTLPPRPGGNRNIALLVVAAVIIVGGAWYFLTREDTPPEATVKAPEPQQAVPQQPVLVAPDIPEKPPAEEPEAEVITLPLLSESDAFTRELISPLNPSPQFSEWLQTDNLLQKSVAVIDGLARGVLLRKIIPVQPPEQKFKAVTEEGQIWLDENSYSRFDSYIAILTAMEPESVADVFHTLRPLLEEALGELGQPADSLDNRLIAAIDLTLAAPDPSGPIALKRESVYYQFADPRLEALPPIQKQMIRMGPENSQALKHYLKKVRAALLAEAEEQD